MPGVPPPDELLAAYPEIPVRMPIQKLPALFPGKLPHLSIVGSLLHPSLYSLVNPYFTRCSANPPQSPCQFHIPAMYTKTA